MCCFIVLENTFSKINRVISNIKGRTFTKNEIVDLSIDIKNILLEADLPYEYIKSLINDLQSKLNKIDEKKLNKSAVIGGILQSYVDSTFQDSNGKGLKINEIGITTIGVFGPNGVGKT